MNISRHELLLRKLPEFYEVQTTEELPARMLALLADLVPSNLAAYNEVNLKAGQVTLQMSPKQVDHRNLQTAFERLMGEHPLIQHQQNTKDLSPHRISDFLSAKQFHRLGIYNEVYRHIDCEDQVALTLQSTPFHIVALAMNRERRNFSGEELDVLRLLQPHLIRVHRNVLLLETLRQQLHSYQSLLETMPAVLVILDAQNRIQFATRQARELLRKYCGRRITGKCLPEAIRRWVDEATKWESRNLRHAAECSLQINGANGTLKLRVVNGGQAGGRYLALEEINVPGSAQSLRVLGLTLREAEVLFWVTQGKSNSDIGIILGSSVRTVQKHLEHIFAKLGVESRTAAAQRAWEILAPGLR